MQDQLDLLSRAFTIFQVNIDLTGQDEIYLEKQLCSLASIVLRTNVKPTGRFAKLISFINQHFREKLDLYISIDTDQELDKQIFQIGLMLIRAVMEDQPLKEKFLNHMMNSDLQFMEGFKPILQEALLLNILEESEAPFEEEKVADPQYCDETITQEVFELREEVKLLKQKVKMLEAKGFIASKQVEDNELFIERLQRKCKSFVGSLKRKQNIIDTMKNKQFIQHNKELQWKARLKLLGGENRKWQVKYNKSVILQSQTNQLLQEQLQGAKENQENQRDQLLLQEKILATQLGFQQELKKCQSQPKKEQPSMSIAGDVDLTLQKKCLMYR